ncbi:hypothetical protein [Sulfuricystis multivorans]|uniref:hypothetical protein n=1 Tax=Sulfuricystis multivorans TaxID=2211108 RepID=UPI000F836DBD|nr:hypothetical protein [Sulfuricystis multivorans]
MRRVMLALFGAAGLLAGLIFWLGPGEGGCAAGCGAWGVFVSVLVVGLPSLYYCCRHGVWELWRFTLLGALAGLLCALPFYAGPYLFGLVALLFVLAGAAFGGLFWLAAIWRNHDLTRPKSIRLPCGTVYRVARNALRQRS